MLFWSKSTGHFQLFCSASHSEAVLKHIKSFYLQWKQDKLCLLMGRKCPGLGAGWAKPTLNWIESGYELLSISCVTLNLLLQSQPICFCRYIRVICSCLQLFGEGAVISTVLLPPLAKAKSVLLNRDFQTISRFSLVFKGIKTKTMKQETYINFTRWYNFSVINQSQIVMFLHFYFIQRTLIFHKKDSLK